MIKSIKATSGFAAELSAMKDHTFEFTEGLNVVFGPNACGKSTLVRLGAAYSMIPCRYGGWSRVPDRDVYGFGKLQFPDSLNKWAPGECNAEVVWDGTPSFLFDASRVDVSNVGWFYDNEAESGDGMTSFETQISQLTSKPSQGLITLHKISIMMEMLENIPDLTKPRSAYEPKKEYMEKIVEYITSLPRDGRITIFLDEPDRSLSINNQELLWTRAIPFLAEKYQVIVATHNMFSLFLGKKETNFIDMVKGERTNAMASVISYMVAYAGLKLPEKLTILAEESPRL